MAEILVTWFSRSGSTAKAARALAQRLGADAVPIVTPVPYSGMRGYVRGVWDSVRRRRPQIAIATDPTRYKLVVVGGPVWAGRPAAPLHTFLRRYGPRLPVLAAFCVSGSGAAYDGVFAEIADLAGHRPLATLSLAERKVTSGEAEASLTAFAGVLREALVLTAFKTGLDRPAGWRVDGPIPPERHEPHPAPRP